jgi:hypothetical protein
MHSAPAFFHGYLPLCPVSVFLISHAALICVPSPDWTFVEALGPGSYDFSASNPPTPEQLVKMWECSPVAHVHRHVLHAFVAWNLSSLQLRGWVIISE